MRSEAAPHDTTVLAPPRSWWRLRARQGWLLVPRVFQTTRWIAPVGGAALGLAVLYLTPRGTTFDLDRLILEVRVAAVALSLGAAFALDDPAADQTASAPAAAPFQRAVRAALFLPVVAALWWIVCAAASAGPLRAATDGAGGLPVGALSLEFAGMVAVTWAAAAVAMPRVPEGLGGIAAGPALLGFLAGGNLFHRLALFAPSPSDAAWSVTHQRWTWVLVGAVVVLIHASQDPGRSRTLRRPRRARAGGPVRP